MRICGLRWGRAEVGGTADPVNASTPLSMDDRPGRERSTSPLTLDYSPEFMLLTMPNESSSLSRGAPVSATPALRIGDVAAAAGVSVDALRFYERRGLLKPAARRASGYREYTSEAVGLVRFARLLDHDEEPVRHPDRGPSQWSVVLAGPCRRCLRRGQLMEHGLLHAQP